MAGDEQTPERLIPDVVMKADDGEPGSGHVHIGRIAVMMLEVPLTTGRSASREIEEAIREKLQSDYRVTEVTERDSERHVENARLYSFHGLSTGEAGPELEVRFDGEIPEVLSKYRVLRLDQAIEFVVRIPIKNQPTYRGISDVPTDTYHVHWDGLALFVCWEQVNTRATASGGHVVFEVLSDVVGAAGFKTHLQACSPGCRHGFIHTDLVSFLGQDPGEKYMRSRGGSPTAKPVRVPFASNDGLSSFTNRLVRDASWLVEDFAIIVNLDFAITDLEMAARGSTSELMKLNFQRSARRPFYTRSGLRQRWRQRADRSAARALVAFLWLLLAQLEELTRDWDARHRALAARLDQESVAVILDDDAMDAGNLRSLDLTLIRSAMTESSARHDTWVLAIATLSGAAAALAGATIGLLA